MSRHKKQMNLICPVLGLHYLRRKLRTDTVLSDRDMHELFSDKMHYIFIELPSFDKEEEEGANDFERWIYVLKNMDTLKRMPFRARKSVFEKLAELAFAQQEGMEKGMAKGIAKGRAEGLVEGRAEGLAEGMEKGLAEGMEKGYEKAQLKNARSMKTAGISPELIVQITGLTPEAIAEL